ncbi:MAG: choice-of-anchor D domain-containing protein [Candidatus Eisenbacteria bacterium]|nr:choice-of-anchor D domain-containing protein [Candidatus Eisenbacteria bacterium]
MSRWLPGRIFPALVGLALGGLFLSAPAAWAQNGFHALYSPDGIDVWAVGGSGAYYRSFDGGLTWTSKTLGADTHRGVATNVWTDLLVSDNGKIHRSTDSGGTWSTATVAGSPQLRGVQLVNASIGWVVGASGTILKSTDGGINWTPQTSGVAVRLNALKFLDDQTGWVVGNGGTILKTIDGGSNWTPLTSGTTKDLYTVDATTIGAVNPVLWAGGKDATALKSTDGGTVWTAQNMKFDSKSDINGVHLLSATHVILVGGGGFVRSSIDGGTSWSFHQHTIQGEMADVLVVGTKAWACNRSNRIVLRSTDGGVNWSPPGGTGVSRALNLVQPLVAGTVRGSSLAQNGQNKNSFYCVLGARVYKSFNRGDTWAQIGTITTVLGSPSKTNAFYVHPADSMLMVAAVGASDRIARSTNGGITWADVPGTTIPFTEYGVPLEMDVNDPNHLILGAEDAKLWQSNDFGATFTLLSNQPSFRSPCDIQILPDLPNTIWVGDGITSSGQGQMFVSTNGGATFALNYTTSGSEIPMIAATRLDVGVGWATHWGSGGVRRTKDAGASWPSVATTGSAWGVDSAKDDPNCMAYGVYSGGLLYLSFDEGLTFTTIANPGSNYSVFMPDRNTVLTEQGGGVYKLATSYTYTPASNQSCLVLAPNGGEVWAAGENRVISTTATNVALARLEYRRAPGQPWQVIGTQTGYVNAFNWTVPNDATTQAKIRIVDAWDGAPVDSSNSFFTIAAPRAQLLTAGLDFATRTIGTSTLLPVEIKSTGTAPLIISNVTTTSGAYLPGRTSFSVAVADTDTVGVTFTPGAPGSYPDTLIITSNAPDSPHRVPLTGIGQAAPGVAVLIPDGGEAWEYNTNHPITWSSTTITNVDIDYETSPGGGWLPIDTAVPAVSGSYNWIVPYTPTTTARVRVRETGGPILDTSDAEFAITAPLLANEPDSVDFGVVSIETPSCVVITLDNNGSAPLVISSITSDSDRFSPVRSSLTIQPASSDTLTICFDPDSLQNEAGTLTLVSNDPFAPHSIALVGIGLYQSGAFDARPAPAVAALRQNRPNPFTGTTRIEYDLPERASVNLDVFDLSGRRVATLVNREQEAGRYAVDFGVGVPTTGGERVQALPSGVYFYRLTAGAFSRTERMLFVR